MFEHEIEVHYTQWPPTKLANPRLFQTCPKVFQLETEQIKFILLML
jgi:hypothetical protein